MFLLFGGMFDWIWDVFYGISKSIFRIIDGLLSCANMLCGIQPIKYQGTETDFLTFLLRNKNISFGFGGAVFIGVILVFIFAVFAVIRSIASEKSQMTPAQVAVKVAKTLITFIAIPMFMAIFVYLMNILMQTLYQTTLGGSPDGIGRFLAGAFGQDARKSGVPENFYLDTNFDYTSTSNVKNYLDLDDYDFFFSYIGGIAILICLAMSLLMFVDRAIAIVILFIFSPISLSTAIIDDGQRFKLWRDQFLVKFLTGYGCIIAINIYALIIAAITSSDLVFFNNGFLNNLMKIAIILGGAVSMQRTMALVGNLISAGAGSNEMRDNAIATSQMRGVMGRIGGAALAPFKAARSAANFVKDSKQYGTGSTIASRLGINTDRNYGKMSKTQLQQSRQQMQERENFRKTGKFEGNGGKDKVSNAILGGGNNQNPGGGGGDGGNHGGNNKSRPGDKMIENSILNNNLNNSNLINNKDEDLK